MISRKKFHVDHDVRPAHVTAILRQLSPFVGDVRTQLLADLDAGGHHINPHYLFWNLKVLRALGLTEVEEKTESWRLTRRGVYLRSLAEWNQRAFFDIMHYLYYASWNFGDQETATFSWTYQTVCNLLWQRRPTSIDGKALAAEVRDQAQQEFGLESVSITDYAIDGVYNWLRSLDPVFAWTDSKTRRRETNSGRAACSPELFLMALDYLFRTKNIDYNRSVLMDDDKSTIVSRVCLLDPTKWRSMLNRTVEQFAIVRRSGSADGPQVLLERAPRLVLWPGETDSSFAEFDGLETPVVAAGKAMAEDLADEDDEKDEEDGDEE